MRSVLSVSLVLLAACALPTSRNAPSPLSIPAVTVENCLDTPLVGGGEDPCRNLCKPDEGTCLSALREARRKARHYAFGGQFRRGFHLSFVAAGLEQEYLIRYRKAPPLEQCFRYDAGVVVVDEVVWQRECGEKCFWWCDLSIPDTQAHYLPTVEYRGPDCDGQNLRLIDLPLRLADPLK